ncbi:MAG: YdeI/OmpD-associated family protein [Candidatus Cyclobacteriaceae bacterium M2_1C_046]
MNEPLLKKLNFKEGESILILHAPKGYLDNWEGLSFDTRPEKEQYDFIQVFVVREEEIPENFSEGVNRLGKNGKLWFSYAKKGSELQTDITRDKGWDIADKHSFVAVRQVAIDKNWSALRFKPKDEIKELNRRNPGEARPKKVLIPKILQEELEKNPFCKEFYNTLSYTNQNEYAQWVASAKKEETRQKRLNQTIEKLKAGIKNPHQE